MTGSRQTLVNVAVLFHRLNQQRSALSQVQNGGEHIQFFVSPLQSLDKNIHRDEGAGSTDSGSAGVQFIQFR